MAIAGNRDQHSCFSAFFFAQSVRSRFAVIGLSQRSQIDRAFRTRVNLGPGHTEDSVYLGAQALPGLGYIRD